MKRNIIQTSNSSNTLLPEGFVFLTDIDATIIESPRYYSSDNFLGRQVPGYASPRIVCTKEAAEHLKNAHEEFKAHGYNIVMYDAYRPQRAVDEFIRWSMDKNDEKAKPHYYPTINKEDVFKLGYFAKKSGHSRGSTFDFTLIKISQKVQSISYSTRKLTNGEEIPFLDDNTVDMGSSFDLLHQASSHDTQLITEAQVTIRNFLRKTMQNHGFKEYSREWWHYTLAQEPFADTYFDFVV